MKSYKPYNTFKHVVRPPGSVSVQAVPAEVAGISVLYEYRSQGTHAASEQTPALPHSAVTWTRLYVTLSQRRVSRPAYQTAGSVYTLCSID